MKVTIAIKKMLILFLNDNDLDFFLFLKSDNDYEKNNYYTFNYH